MSPFTDASVHAPVAGRRIALFSGAYNHISDGVTLTLNRLVRYLENHGAKALVFAPTTNKAPALVHNGTLISVPSIPVPGRSDYRLSIGLSRKGWSNLEAFEPDLIHIATPDYAGAQALKWAKSRQIPAVSSFHTHFTAYLKYFAKYNPLYSMDFLEDTAWRYARWFYSQVEHIYVPSPSIGDMLRSHRITRGIRVWARGVDPNQFSPDHRNQTWRFSHGFEEEDIVISYVGRLVWEKNLAIFADVLEHLSASGIAHKILIVGDGPAQDILKERLSGAVFTGPLSGKELATAYASSDVFLFPSDTETFGNVTLEAMASGLPTVCANASGSDLLVLDGKSGYLAPAQDTDAFLEHVTRLISDDSLRKTLGNAARERAMTFEWTNIMNRLTNYYQEIWQDLPEKHADSLATFQTDRPIRKAVA